MVIPSASRENAVGNFVGADTENPRNELRIGGKTLRGALENKSFFDNVYNICIGRIKHLRALGPIMVVRSLFKATFSNVESTTSKIILTLYQFSFLTISIFPHLMFRFQSLLHLLRHRPDLAQIIESSPSLW